MATQAKYLKSDLDGITHVRVKAQGIRYGNDKDEGKHAIDSILEIAELDRKWKASDEWRGSQFDRDTLLAALNSGTLEVFTEESDVSITDDFDDFDIDSEEEFTGSSGKKEKSGAVDKDFVEDDEALALSLDGEEEEAVVPSDKLWVDAPHVDSKGKPRSNGKFRACANCGEIHGSPESLYKSECCK